MNMRSGGIRSWVAQRLTAVYIGIYLVAMFVWLATHSAMDQSAWNTWMSLPLINIGTALFWLALCWHVWIGMRDVVMDYVSQDGLRFAILALVGFYLIFIAVWSLRVVLTIKGSS